MEKFFLPALTFQKTKKKLRNRLSPETLMNKGFQQIDNFELMACLLIFFFCFCRFGESIGAEWGCPYPQAPEKC
jgi:hypothetical protein